MKKFALFLIAGLFAGLNIMAQGVDFRPLTFDEALATAKKENKLIFLDGYTVWCGPCKNMTENIFPQKECGDFFNKHFVNVKFDMEKGEGVQLARRFGVRAYPTFLILDANGEEVYRIVGGGSVEGFIARVKHGMDPKNRIPVLEKEYATGNMSKKRMMDYYTSLKDAYNDQKAKKISDELFQKLNKNDKLNKIYWPLLESVKPNSEDFTFILENISTLRKNVGDDKVNSKVNGTLGSQIQSLTQGRDVGGPQVLQKIEDIRFIISKYDIQNKDDLLNKLNLAEVINKGNVDELIQLINTGADDISVYDIFGILHALTKFSDNVDKNKAQEILKAGENLVDMMEESEFKEYMKKSGLDDLKLKASEGVYWRNMNLEEAQGLAKNTKQLIFVDCYTTWCGPCKYMTENIFPLAEVGEFFNKNFINIKLDMETAENKAIGTKYGVRAFPTFLILNGEGEVVHKFVGGGDAKGIIARTEVALDPEKNLKSMVDKYENGNRDKQFLAQYVKTLESAYEPKKAGEIANNLFDLLDDNEKISDEYWFLIESRDMTPFGSERFNYLLDNKSVFVNTIEAEKVNKKIDETLNSKVYGIMRSNGNKEQERELSEIQKDLKDLNDIQNIIKKNKIDNKKLSAQVEVAKVFVDGDIKKLMSTSRKNFKYFGDNEVMYIGFPVITYLNKSTEGKQNEQVAALANSLSSQIENERLKQMIPTLLEKKEN